ncbi:SUMF1/EgtB/PvdO family nonheme iron enzyme [Segatella copri]|jgi:formylglycine-generating enzyme required for sulfatase activity|nr:SUMF1/EgtB/PvdO family nonheme iron enzyme [Segatella copri]MEE0650935.1 SUMF1/EgtB/PvdO family nonheme iron enzyme [Segatella copri]
MKYITFKVGKIRKVFALFILLLFSISVYSQELHVKSFGIAESDLSAQTQPRKDLNDKNCALVKVQFVGGISEIEGNVITPLIKHGNETWVYMPQGSRQMKVLTQSFLPVMVTFVDYGIEKLESNRTYVLILTKPMSIIEQKKQALIIKYSPSSATVLVDNKMVRGTNGVAKVVLPVGQHSYIVASDGYESEEGTVKLKAAAPSNLQITLSKETNTISTSTNDVATQHIVRNQIVKFSGKVVDINGQPVIGAVVEETGTKNISVTDIDGNFIIKAKSSSITVTVTFLGCVPKQVKLTEGTKEEITLIEETYKKQPSSSASSITIPVKDGISIEMVKVEGGTFMMGATPEMKNSWTEERPIHQVTLTNDYYIGKYEVTQSLWCALMDNNPSYFKGDNLPVEQVSWDDCQKFINKLNDITGRKFRLPTEAEWEYAARGGKKSRGYQYSGSNKISDVAWYSSNSEHKTQPVGLKLANELGLYDMSGNVDEWCFDRFGFYSALSQTNPLGADDGICRVYRGGSWEQTAGFCRSSDRSNYGTSKNRIYNLGFRLALSE